MIEPTPAEAIDTLQESRSRPPTLARLNAMVRHYRREKWDGPDYVTSLQDAIDVGVMRSGINIIPFFREDSR